MKIKLKKQIGTSLVEFEIEEAKVIDALALAGSLSEIPDKCSCGSKDVKLSSNKADGFTFIKVKCNACGATSGLGQYKDGGYFWKQFVKFEGKKELPIIES